MTEIRRILIPVDFSEPSATAARYAAQLASALDARVEVMHVYDANDYAILEGSGYVAPVTHDLEKAIDDKLAKFTATLAECGPQIGYRVVRGVPYEAIATVAEQCGADLVVMGTHGRTGFKHMLLGSVAEKVVRVCKVPVLTVHAKADKAA